MSPEAKAIVYGGGGGVAVLGLATLGLIAWMFLSALPTSPHRAVAHNDDASGDPSDDDDGEGPDPRKVADGNGDATPPDNAPGNAGTPDTHVPDLPPVVVDDSLVPFIRCEFPAELRASAFDPARGQLALAGPWVKAVGFVTTEQLSAGAEPDNVQLVELTGVPTHLEYKPLAEGGVFLVAQQQPDALVLIDAETRELLHNLPLESGTVFWMSAPSNRDVRVAWIATSRGSNRRTLHRCDLDEPSIAESFGAADLRDFVAADDGSVLYCRSSDQPTGRGPIEPDRLARSSWDNDAPHQAPDYSYVVAAGRYVVSGTQVYSLDFRVRHPDLAFEAEAFLPERPWAAGIEDSEFVVGSINDGRIVTRFPLPPELHRVQDPQHRQRGRDALDRWSKLFGGWTFADSARDRFLLVTPRHVLEFPLDELDLPDEPLLRLADDAPGSASVGRPYEFTLRTVSGDPTAELIEAPDGAALDGGTLRWTPGPEQFGPQEVAVRLTAGDVSRETRWTVQVSQRTLPVAFLVRGSDASVDGSRLVVWGHDWPTQPASRGDRLRFAPDHWRVAVVDLADLSLVAESEIAEPIHQVEFCGPEVVMSDTIDGLATLTRLSAEDLSEIGRAEVLGGEMTCIADQLLAVRAPGQIANDQVKLYTLPEIALREEDAEEPEPGSGAPSNPFQDVTIEEYGIVYGARRMADGWLLDGALWDDELRDAVLLIEPQGFLRVSERSLPRPTIDTQRLLSGFVYDSVPASEGGRIPPEIQALLRGQSRGEDFRFDSPHIAARFRYRFSDNSAFLDLTDLDADDPYQSIPLRTGATERHYPYPDDQKARFTTSPDFIFVTLTGETFVIPIEPRPVPFRIEPRQSELELESGRRTTRVTYEAQGATRFELEIPALGTVEAPYRLESEDGEFRIDGVDPNQLSAAVWAAAPRGAAETVRQQMQEQIDRGRDAWERYIGRRAPPGVPVRIDARVRATSDNGEVAVLKHAYVVMIPIAIFERNQP